MDAGLHAVQFDEVVSSVYQSYPLLESALLSRNIAQGQRVGASGAFDLKLKGASENGPQGFLSDVPPEHRRGAAHVLGR
jgi:hypothetical protein